MRDSPPAGAAPRVPVSITRVRAANQGAYQGPLLDCDEQLLELRAEPAHKLDCLQADTDPVDREARERRAVRVRDPRAERIGQCLYVRLGPTVDLEAPERRGCNERGDLGAPHFEA